jgi:hypothetical protein
VFCNGGDERVCRSVARSLREELDHVRNRLQRLEAPAG